MCDWMGMGGSGGLLCGWYLMSARLLLHSDTQPCRRCWRLDTLTKHSPDTYITNGLVEGFRIRFQRTSDLRSAAAQHAISKRASQHSHQVHTGELSRGRMLGPFQVSKLTPVYIHCFGVIPKGNVTRKWCLITDLSV